MSFNMHVAGVHSQFCLWKMQTQFWIGSRSETLSEAWFGHCTKWVGCTTLVQTLKHIEDKFLVLLEIFVHIQLFSVQVALVVVALPQKIKRWGGLNFFASLSTPLLSLSFFSLFGTYNAHHLLDPSIHCSGCFNWQKKVAFYYWWKHLFMLNGFEVQNTEHFAHTTALFFSLICQVDAFNYPWLLLFSRS